MIQAQRIHLDTGAIPILVKNYRVRTDHKT